jgi:hypothetical protein
MLPEVARLEKNLNRNSRVFYFVLLVVINLLYFTLCSFRSEFVIQFNSYSLLCIINLFFVIFFFSRSLVNANLHILENLFWIYQLVFLAMTPLTIEWDSEPSFLNQQLKFIENYDVMTLVFICNLMVGLFSIHSSKLVRKPKFDYHKLAVRTRVLSRAYFLIAPFLIAFIGVRYLLRTIRYSVAVDFGPLLYIGEALLYVLPAVLFLSYCVLQIANPSKYFRNRCVLFAIFLLLLSNPVANPRQTTLLVLIPCIYPVLRVSEVRTRIFSLIVLAFTIFSSNLFDRFSGRFIGVRFEPLSRLGDYDSFSQLSYVFSFSQEGMFKPMRQVLGSLFFFIPREIWPSKPIDTGVMVGVARNLQSTNLSCPWIAEMYANGGVFLALLTSILFGVGFSKLGQVPMANRFLVEGILCGVAFIVLRGSLLQASGKTMLGLFACAYLLRGLNSKKVVNDEYQT